jgi:hypothetical protein
MYWSFNLQPARLRENAIIFARFYFVQCGRWRIRLMIVRLSACVWLSLSYCMCAVGAVPSGAAVLQKMCKIAKPRDLFPPMTRGKSVTMRLGQVSFNARLWVVSLCFASADDFRRDTSNAPGSPVINEKRYQRKFVCKWRVILIRRIQFSAYYEILASATWIVWFCRFVRDFHYLLSLWDTERKFRKTWNTKKVLKYKVYIITAVYIALKIITINLL